MTRALVVAATLVVACGAAAGAWAQSVLESTPIAIWGVNREVRALARVGRTLYVGGDFDVVGPPSGGLAIASALDPSAITPSNGVGTVGQVASDGAGGWYVAEWAQFIDTGYKVAVRHVRSDGSLDPAWTPALFDAGASIYSLVAAGGRVYVAGSLSTVNGVNHVGPVALDGATGAVLPWVLPTRTTGAPYGVLFAAAADGRVYFPVQSTPPDILAVDGATGVRLPFLPELPPYVVSIGQLAATSTRVFAVGEGCGTGGVGQGVCAFDAATGARVWTWAATAPSSVSGVWSGSSRLYVWTRNPETLYALDAATGAATTWTVPDIGVVFDLEEAGGRVYVSTSRGQTSLRAVAFDATTAAETNWNPLVEGVNTVAAYGDRIALGGGFRTAGGIRRRHLVALDLDTGRPAAVQPAEPFGAVNALATYGDIVFVGMESALPEVYAFSSASGQKYAWGIVPNGRPLALVVAGQTLYIGGFFSQLSGQNRGFLGAVDLTTGALLPWNPELHFEVSEMSASATRLYVAGRVGGPYGSTIGNAAFDLSTRQRLPFDAPLQFVSSTRYLAATRDRVLTTARFYYPPRAFGVAWLDPRSGAVQAEVRMPFWTTHAGGHGDTVVVGGVDETTGRVSLGALDATTGTPLAWNPPIDSPGGAYLGRTMSAIFVQPDLTAVGGAMANVNGRQVSNLAVFRAVAPRPPQSIGARVTGFTATVSWLSGGAPRADAYVVEAGSSSGAADVGVFLVGAATVVSGTLGAGRYFVRVKGLGAGGVSPVSSEVILDLPALAAPPAAPATLTGAVTAGVVTLQWQAAAGNPTTYVVEAGTAPGLTNLAVFATGHLDTRLAAAPPPGTYVVRVRAANAFGTSGPSNEITLVVPW